MINSPKMLPTHRKCYQLRIPMIPATDSAEGGHLFRDSGQEEAALR